jgi:RNA polymerase sigma-70 factor (ECF subfamily)
MTNDPSKPQASTRDVELAARHAYGRVLAVVACATRDMNAAEDALADALVEALVAWPRDGTPSNPEGWLVVAARRNLLDQSRANAAARRAFSDPGVVQRIEELLASSASPEREHADPSRGEMEARVDERLSVMFACTHPALEVGVRTPLMLQALMGLPATRIAAAFMIAPSAMSQRLVRAKLKLRDGGIDFAMPPASDLASRLPAVLDAIYAAYAAAHDEAIGSVGPVAELASEAIDLARLVTGLLPEHSEAWGLRAIVLLSHARRDARRDGKGRFVPLPHQDCDLWDRDMICEGESCLERAASCVANAGGVRRFGLEAAIQSVHVDRRRTGRTDWPAIVRFYESLLLTSPSVGASIGLAGALVMMGEATRALALLDALPTERVRSHQPFWAVRAEAMRALHRHEESSAAFDLAIGLSADHVLREYLMFRRNHPAESSRTNPS